MFAYLPLAALGWTLYRSPLAAVWAILAAYAAYALPQLAPLTVALMAAAAAAPALERFRAQLAAVVLALSVARPYAAADLYAAGAAPPHALYLDGAFVGLSAFLVLAFRFKPARMSAAAPAAAVAAAVAGGAEAAASALAGPITAMSGMGPRAALGLAAADLALCLLLGDPLPFLAPAVYLASFFATYRRLSYTSPNPPAGWLHSWLAGKYRVLGILGVGGFSYVLKVEGGGRIYAAKVLRYVDDMGEPLAQDESVLAAFGQEMNRYLEIRSPHVVRAYEVYLPVMGYRSSGDYMRNPPYILLEYMDGGTLRDLLRGGPLPVGQVAELLASLARGLADVHRAGVAHLDVKPENILFSRDGTAKLGDMGIAKLMAGGQARASYMSPAYAAPEVRRGVATYASDIYSLGCVAYEALTGINPNAFVEGGYEIPPPSAYRPEVPPWLDGLILRMLDARPEARPTAEEVVNNIKAASAGRA